MFIRLSLAIPFVLTSVFVDCLAQPSLEISSPRSGRNLEFNFQSLEGCSYRLHASSSKKKLAKGKGKLISEQLTPGVLLTDLPRVKRAKKSTVSLFFSISETCEDLTTEGNPVRLRLRTTTGNKARTLEKYLQRVKRELSQSTLKVALTEVFTAVSFSKPVDFAHAGDSRIFVVEQEGLISVFDSVSESEKSIFLDITPKTNAEGERGLFSVAFHPNYSANGFFFIHYTDEANGDTVVERYRVDPNNPNSADPASALEFLRVSQPFSNHNGGEMEFGPDGYLYLSLGDGGSGGDPQGNGQDRRTLLGNILRIDVDTSQGSTPYAIPNDNPFLGNSQGYREEIFAYGARNIWKFSFDAANGDLWAADVGQGAREEVNKVNLGDNLGWNTTEGFLCFSPASDCDKSGLTNPVLDYPRADGKSVTGGFVYRGRSIPALQGYYVFGDFLGGDSSGGVIWGFPVSANAPTKQTLNDTKLFLSAFGQDRSGELYALTFNDGKIFRIDPVS